VCHYVKSWFWGLTIKTINICNYRACIIQYVCKTCLGIGHAYARLYMGRRVTSNADKKKSPMCTWRKHSFHRDLIQISILLWGDGFLKWGNKVLCYTMSSLENRINFNGQNCFWPQIKMFIHWRTVLQEWISTCSFYLYFTLLYSCKRYLKVNKMLHGRMGLLCSGLKYVRISSTKGTGNMRCWIHNWQTLHSAVHFPIQTQYNEDVSSFIKLSV
jgi:hypothetical protein